MPAKPFLITGCARSGTLWWSEVMQRLDIPCLHERQFTLGRHGPLQESEASWMAVPYLKNLKKHAVMQTVRHPAKVIASLVRRQTFPDSPFGRWAAHHVPFIGQWKSPADQAAAYWYAWNLSITQNLGRTPTVVLLDSKSRSVPTTQFLMFAGWARQQDQVAEAMTLGRRNATGEDLDPFDLGLLPDLLRHKVVKLATILGYDMTASLTADV